MAWAIPAWAQAPLRKIGEADLSILGVSATVDPLNPSVPKNVASAVRLVVTAGGTPLTSADVPRFLGAGFQVAAELSGPGLPGTITIPQAGSPPLGDPLLLPLPPLAIGGDYLLSNPRIVVGGRSVLDAVPQQITVHVIDQILVTSVQTRPLTLDEIKARGIVLDSSAFLGFEFTLGLMLESTPVNFTFPVVFNNQGVSVPLPITPPPDPTRQGVSLSLPPLPTIVPVLLTGKDSSGQDIPLTLPGGAPVQIPGVLVIPGNVGYLKQFFAADLYVANGAPAGSGLVVHSVTGTIHLPPGADGVVGTADDPLSLPATVNGPQPSTMPVRSLGPDGKPDVDTLNPGDQGQAEFLIRGEKEGYATIDFGIAAVLEGLPVGPVNVTGKASGGVLVRNPFFDMTFTVPSVVRRGEKFKLFTTITNIGQGLANALTVSLDSGALSGVLLLSDPSQVIATLKPGNAQTLEFDFQSQKTGQVVASYLHLNTQDGSTGELKFTLGIGERGVPLSPDTLVLPASVDALPTDVVDAAMRVLGQAWSVANAPSGTLPKGVIRTSKTVVFQKGLALAEAGLRVTLGENLSDALRDIGVDFYGGPSLDPGFDQILRQTDAGRSLALALGNELVGAVIQAGGPLPYERSFAQLQASGPDFISFAVGSGTSGAPVDVAFADGALRQSLSGTTAAVPRSDIPGGVIVPLGPPATAPLLGLLTAPSASPYTLRIAGRGAGPVDISVTLPRGDGTLVRGSILGVAFTAGLSAKLAIDLLQPDSLVLAVDTAGDGTFATAMPLVTEVISPQGPQLLSANVIGPETLDGASAFGLDVALLFDRIVDDTASSALGTYQVPSNSVVAAKRQLSGRIVFMSLAAPEGPYVLSSVSESGILDPRGTLGPALTQPLRSLLQDAGAVVSGRVFNADGTAVTSGVVTYLNQADMSCIFPFEKPLAAVSLNGQGRYQLRYVRQDNCGSPFMILTQDPSSGAVRQVSSFVRAAGERIVLDLALEGRGTVEGTVRDIPGHPVPGAVVVALSTTDAQSGGTATTDGQGQYVIPGITVGPVSVRAAKGTFVGRAAGRVDRAGTASVVDVTLNTGSVHVTGTVLLVQGTVSSPLPDVTVVYGVSENPSLNPTPVGVTKTAGDGTYSLDSMPPGSVVITAYSQYGIVAVGFATVAGDQLTGKNLVFQAQDQTLSGTVQGVVRLPDTTPAPGVVVSIDGRGVLTDATGAFSIPNAPVKPNVSQTVSAATQDGLRSGFATFVLGSPNQVVSGLVITLSGLGTAKFTVLDPAGKPIANQELRTPCVDVCWCSAMSTGPDGTVTFTGVGLGDFNVKAIRMSGGVTDVAYGKASIKRDGDTGFGVVQFAGAGTVTGKVFNPDGTPSFGASVALSSRHFFNDGLTTCDLIQEVSHRFQTGPDGLFTFTGVNVGPLVASASQPFFPTAVGVNSTLLQDSQTVTLPPLRLVNTIAGVLSGAVFLPDGTTTAGAGVQVTATGPLPDITVTTDGQGQYHFAKILPEGLYQVTVSDPVTGGLGRESVYLAAGQDTTHNMRLKGRGTVTVTVVDGAGSPVTSAFVRVRETEYPNRVYEGSIDASNQGVATFPNVFEGPLSVEASDSFGRGGRTSAVLPRPGGTTISVQVSLTVTGTVQGHFYMPDGATVIPFGVVSLTAGGRTIGQVTTAGSGDVGSFSFSFVPAGPVRLDAQDPLTGRTGLAVGTVDSQDQVVTLNVLAQALGTVTGSVTQNEQPVASVKVVVASGAFQAVTYSDGTGQYVIKGVPEGHVVVTASFSDGSFSGTAAATLTGEGTTLTVNVALQGSGQVTGQVLSAGGATPAPTSLVSLQVSGSASLTTTTDATGNYRFDQVPTGRASLTATVLGSIDEGMATATVPAGGAVQVPITLNGVGVLSGVGVDSAGNPVDGTLKITGTGSFPYFFYLILSKGSGGTFQLPQVLAGPFTAALTSVSAGGANLYGTASERVSPGQTTQLTVALQPTGTITGSVLRPDGKTPAYGASVTVDLDQGRGSLTTQAQSDGTFALNGVPLGAFTLRINDPLTSGLGLVQGRSLDTNLQILSLGTIVLDDTPIAVVSVSPSDGAAQVAVDQPVVIVFSERVQSFAGVTVSNGPANIPSQASLAADGVTLTLSPTPSWPDEKQLTLTIPTSVTDVLGRPLAQFVVTRFQTVDLTPPSVSTVVPASGAIQVDPAAVLTVSFSEALSPTLTNLSSLVTLGGPGGPVAGTTVLASSNSVTFTPASPLATNVLYTVTVNGSVDLAGNLQTVPFGSTFATLDTIPPTLSASFTTATGSGALVNGTFLGSSRPTLAVTLFDALSGVNMGTAGLSLDGNAVPAVVQGNSLVFTPSSGLVDGVHTLQASGADRAGNSGTLSVSFGIDTVPPSAAQITGVAEAQVVRGTITLGATATDAGSGVARIDILSDGFPLRSLIAPSFSTALDTTTLVEGIHDLAARAVDGAGNVGPLGPDVHIIVDNQPLTLVITSPPNGARFRDSVLVKATVSKSVDHVDFSVGSQTLSVTSAPYQASLSLASLADGPATVTVKGFAPGGETATATLTVVVVKTPPPAPNPALIDAEPPSAGASLVFGRAGSVQAAITVQITNTGNGALASAGVQSDGSFSATIAAAADDTLSLIAVDDVGNRSAATLVVVRRTPSLPPSNGTTSLTYLGILVDRVGPGPAALTPDGALDAVFTLSLSIGQGVTRQLSFIDLAGPLTRSTRPQVGSVLGVAADVGAPLLNGPDGQVSFPVTTGATLTLFASDFGLIQPGATYTVTAGFADGSNFVGSFTIVAPQDKPQIAHSMTLSASPTTVAVPAGAPATTTLTITNIRDIDGTLLLDGAKIAVAVADMASTDPRANPFRSAGGAIVDGVPAANNTNFQVFTISGGTVTATYSSASVTPAPVTGALALVQIQAADTAGNVLGTHAVGTLDLNLRPAADRAIVSPSPSSLYADRVDRRSQVTVSVRDAAGNPLPDGTPVVLTAADLGSLNPDSSYVRSAGGAVLGGQPSPSGGSYQVFTVTGGTIRCQYSDASLAFGAVRVSPAIIQVLPATSTGAVADNHTIGTAQITLVGADIADVEVSSPSVALSSPARPVSVVIRQLRDARANLIPDGATVLISANDLATITFDGSAYVRSLGGAIVDGVASPSGQGFKVFSLSQGQALATYSSDGASIGPGQVGTVNLQVEMGDPSGTLLDNHALAVAPLSLVGPANAVGSATPPSVLAEGGVHTATVVFTPVLDAYGNPLPDGSKVAATVQDLAAVTENGCCNIRSAGGQILGGDASPSGSAYKALTIQGGKVTFTYADQNVTAGPGEVKQANASLLEAGSDGSVLSTRAVGVVPIALAGVTSGTMAASPGYVHADDLDNRTSVTLSNIRDANGQPVPDGTLLAFTAADQGSVTQNGCCYIRSAGGVIVGGTPASFGAQYKLFPVTSGQVVLQYSAQGVAAGSAEQKTATVQALTVTPAGSFISNLVVATASIALVGPTSANVAANPPDVFADGGAHLSQITLSALVDTGGTPIPDGAKVGLTAADIAAATEDGCCYVRSAGGQILTGGTTPGDGAPASNDARFGVFTVAGGRVQAAYSDQGLALGVNETRVASVAVVPVAGDTNGIVTNRAFGVGTINLRGTSSTMGSGPPTLPLSGGQGTITFSGIKDSAGNTVPDGTLVVVSAADIATVDPTSNGYNRSTGGTILGGGVSPTGLQYRVFSVLNGSITVTYSTAGASSGTAEIQVAPAGRDGAIIGFYSLVGGVWNITVQ